MTDSAPPERSARSSAEQPYEDPANVAESAAALDRVIEEMEQALRDLGTSAVSASQADRTLRRIGRDLDRLRGMALPAPLRRAAAEAEERITEAIDLVTPEPVQRASSRASRGAVRATSRTNREVARLVETARSGVVLAADEVRPQLIRNAARLNRVLDYWQAGLFRVLWLIVPPESLLRRWRFQALLVSRFFTDVALQALLYGALVATARGGGTALDAAVLGVAALLPGVVLGLYGGTIADALPQRVALALAYVGMAVACFSVAWVSDAGFWALVVVLFAVRALHQVSQPSEASAVPLTADSAELASANSMMSLASSAGEVVGKALLAPVLVRAYGVRSVVTAAGVLFLLAATRVFDLAFETDDERHGIAERRAALAEDRPETTGALPWLAASPDVLWMLLLAAIASTVGVVLGVLGPEYVSAVLEVDPANALYVFLPAALGLLVALSVAPLLIHRLGERRVATVGFAAASIAIAGLGLVDAFAPAIEPLLLWQPRGLTAEVATAGLLTLPLGVGTTLAAAATQTYVGRYVPASIHGRAFALLGVLKDGLAVVPLIGFGWAAGVFGIRPVLVAAPVALFVLAAAVAWWSARLAGAAAARRERIAP
ncbi:MAG: MFS transporter [Dehalococcoidia bacterium]|nr:MFS transporter [Dehalococcoidia bacterium]MCB9482559.1 MFS transporter [Dehalococcoidia bacterium]